MAEDKLRIIPTEFRNVRTGDVSYGYHAFDGDGETWETRWDQLPEDDLEFLDRLIDRILSAPQATPLYRQWIGALLLGFSRCPTAHPLALRVVLWYNVDMENDKKRGAMEYQRDEHRVHLIVYHLVWAPKRRKPILGGSIAADCRRLIEEKCKEKGWEILELAINLDHVHLFVRVFPTTAAAEVIKECKGVTSHELRAKYPVLLKLPSLWTRSYFASTAGNVSSDTIQRYIAAQRGM